MHFRRIFLIATIFATFGAASVAMAASGNRFNAHLAGHNEVPAVETAARGQAIFSLSKDGTELHYRLIVANIEGVVQAHIHCAPAGTNGPVVAFLYGLVPVNDDRVNGVLAEGVITDADILVSSGCATTLSELVDVIRDGNAYVNVHTADNPPGEIRGQLK